MRIIAKLTRHFVRSLDTAGEDIDPIVLVNPQAVVTVTLGVHFLPFFTEPPKSYANPLRSIFNTRLHNCTGVPEFVIGVDMIPYIETHPPIVIWRPAASNIEPRQRTTGNRRIGVLVLDGVLFILLREKNPSGPAAETCRCDVGLHHVNSFANLRLVPLQFASHTQGEFQGSVQIIVFVVITTRIEDTTQSLRSHLELTLHCPENHIVDTLLHQPLNLLIE